MKKIKIMSLWSNKTKDGKEYISGTIGKDKKIMVFKNTYKKNERDPDWNVFLCEDEKEDLTYQQQKPIQQNIPIHASLNQDFEVPF